GRPGEARGSTWKDGRPLGRVGAKLSRLDQLLQRPVRGGDDPDVAPDRLRAADPLELLLLEHAKQLRLEVQRQVADLVEEEGAAVCELEAADPSRDGTGEGAALVAEELALQEAGGDGGAVELDERASAPGAERVDQAPAPRSAAHPCGGSVRSADRRPTVSARRSLTCHASSSWFNLTSGSSPDRAVIAVPCSRRQCPEHLLEDLEQR